ncbi:hypothetical protein [Aeromicrobium sp.]|uniref:hypothetical protein n=1 Tax=Aeromicrobium sp. TaxID=1871063 RepID=UPI001985B514|nr:hypothetical protein [Aeromicrobium sp.]MBC7630852.1 hypothetical protein [Aeromicrobium sp.]
MTAAPGAGPAIFRIGLKNVLGSNWTRGEHAWANRAPMLERELLGPEGMQASVYFFIEANRRAERVSLRQMLRRWDVVRTVGNNDAYNNRDEHRLLSKHELPLGTHTRQQRYVTIVRYRHLPSGVEWTAATTHLSSSVGTTAEKAAASRQLQGGRLAELCQEHRVDVLAADLNNVVVRPDTPRGILEAAGYQDWRSVTAVENVEHDTHHALGAPPPRRGKHLDAIYVGPRVTVLDGRVQTSEPDSSDHFGLVCTVSVAESG